MQLGQNMYMTNVRVGKSSTSRISRPRMLGIYRNSKTWEGVPEFVGYSLADVRCQLW